MLLFAYIHKSTFHLTKSYIAFEPNAIYTNDDDDDDNNYDDDDDADADDDDDDDDFDG